MIKLKNLGSNKTVIDIEQYTLYFSYETCVMFEDENGIFIDECPVYGQESGISKTTARHIKIFLDGREGKYIPHENFMNLLGTIGEI